MQKWILACMLLALNITTATAQSYDEKVRNYINQFKQLAIEEQLRSGIPASITLAQGIHETSAGMSELATNANNHFGIKCKKSWTGETYAYTDDAPNECFRKYPSAFLSYKDHSDYLSKAPRYASLFTLSKTDYASWAKGLRQAGYATNPKYAQILIRLIEDYRLQEYTYAAMDNSIGSNVAISGEVIPEHDAIPVAATVATAPVIAASIPVEETMPAVNKKKSRIVVSEVSDNSPADASVTYPPYGEQVKVNGLKAIYAKKGDMPLEYALKTNIRYEKLLEINDISDKPLPADMYLYLEKKHSKGLRTRHVVKEGETIAKVSQYEGVQAKSIRSMNQLGANDEPVPGTILYLQEETTRKPQLISRTEPANIPTVVVPDPTPTPVPPATPAIATDIVPANENTLASANLPEPSAAPAEVAATVPVTDIPEVVTTPVEVANINKEIGPATPPPTPAVPAPDGIASAPNPPVNIANEKPVEEVIKEEKRTAQTTPPPPAAEEPKDELDALKARFDKVVYSRKAAVPKDSMVAPVAEVKKEETVVAATPEIPIKKEPVAANLGPKFYVVKKGDTAFSIAKKNNISMRQLMDWNKLDFEAIKVGQRLRIQEP